jgi:tetratricopeptide (TPR) repeat protein
MSETALQTVEQALRQHQTLLKQYGDDPSVRRETAQAYGRAGFIQLQLGRWSAAEATLQKGIDLYNTLPRTAAINFDRTRIVIDRSHALRYLERWDESAASYHEAIGLLEELIAADSANESYELCLAITLVNLSIVLTHEAQTEASQWAYCRAIGLQRAVIERNVGWESPESAPAGQADEEARRQILAARELRMAALGLGSGNLHALQRKRLLTDLAISLDDLARLLRSTPHGDSTEIAEIAIREALELRQLAVRGVQGEDWRQVYLARSRSHVAELEMSQGDYREAARAYEAALLLRQRLANDFPHRVPYQSALGVAYSDLGRVQRKLGRRDLAVKSHRQAITIHERVLANAPDTQPLQENLSRSLYEMGRVLQDDGRIEPSMHYFERATEVNPKSWHRINHLAWMLVMAPEHGVRDPQRALALAERAVELMPLSPNCWNTLGVAYYRNGEDGQARDALMRAIELSNGGDALDWFFLAMAHARRNEPELADEWLQRAQTWCLAQQPLSGELQRTREEAIATLTKLGH